MRRPLVLVTVVLASVAGCGGEDDPDRPAASAERTERAEPATPAPPPDAGTQTGHGADRPSRTEVPGSDASPPKATIVLASPERRTLARASEPGMASGMTVRLTRPVIRGTTVGLDENGGVARVRVSVREEIVCQAGPGGGEPARLRTRYFPPPQVERIRSNPGALLPTRKVRSLQIELSTERCADQRAEIRGELWGEAINGSGLEAVTPHLRFLFRARAAR
jgi:hypothetical protein